MNKKMNGVFMKKGDLIIVYKVFVGGYLNEFNDEDVKKMLKDTTERLNVSNSDGIVSYVVPVHYEPEHPIEVIDTLNVNTNVLKLLEELLYEKMIDNI